MKGFRHRAALLMLLAIILCPGLVRGEPPPLPEATNLWKFSLATSLIYNFSQSTPALAPEGTIYQATFDGTLFAVTPAGKEKWRFKAKAGREIKSSPAIADDGTIYFGSRDRNFYAVTPAGKLKWIFSTAAWVDSSPAIAAEGTIYFGSWDKHFYALNPNGTLKWKLAVGAIVDSSPAIAADGTIYFGSHDKYFYALNPDSTVRWKFLTGGEIISSPALGAGGVIYFTSLDGNLYALNPDGTERWRYHTGSTTEASPVLDAAGNLCLGCNDRTEVVSKDGKKLWHSGVATGMAAVAAADRFYYTVPGFRLQAITTADRRVWTINLAANATAAPVLGADGIIFLNAERNLFAIQPPDGPWPPAQSAWPMFRANARHTGRVGK